MTGVGVHLNMQPPALFQSPVKIVLPIRGTGDVRQYYVYFYNGEVWLPACYPDGTVTSEGDGLIVPGSRVNRNDTSPPSIEFQVYHFTGFQAAQMNAETSSGGGGGGGNCFIDSAGSGVAWNGRVLLLLTTFIAIIGFATALMWRKKQE